jgi:hypothetical protein
MRLTIQQKLVVNTRFPVGNLNVVLCKLIQLLIKCPFLWPSIDETTLCICRYERKYLVTKISVLVSCK